MLLYVARFSTGAFPVTVDSQQPIIRRHHKQARVNGVAIQTNQMRTILTSASHIKQMQPNQDTLKNFLTFLHFGKLDANLLVLGVDFQAFFFCKSYIYLNHIVQIYPKSSLCKIAALSHETGLNQTNKLDYKWSVSKSISTDGAVICVSIGLDGKLKKCNNSSSFPLYNLGF